MKIRRYVFAIAALFMMANTAFAQLRPMIYEEVRVSVSAADAFNDWTTEDGIEAFFAPEATINLVPGGLYELCFAPDAPDGACGNDDGTILAFEPDAMLSFTWAMPPYMPEIRPHLTVVQLLFEPNGPDETTIRLFHTGFGSSDAWAQGRNYFEETWPVVLENYRQSKADQN
jgi:uncharacterized protein YndB with AHSA1/START domain